MASKRSTPHGTMEEQWAYLNMCLDVALETAINSKIDQKTQIFQDEQNYMNAPQPRVMAMSTFIPTLKKKAEEADIVDL